MAVHRYKDLIVWQLANTFKLSVYQLLRGSPAAQRNLRYRDQLETSSAAIAKHISEGFLRFRPETRTIPGVCPELTWRSRRLDSGRHRLRLLQRGRRRSTIPARKNRISKGDPRLRSAQFRYLEAQPKKSAQLENIYCKYPRRKMTSLTFLYPGYPDTPVPE